jgi:hypothetical protein
MRKKRKFGAKKKRGPRNSKVRRKNEYANKWLCSFQMPLLYISIFNNNTVNTVPAISQLKVLKVNIPRHLYIEGHQKSPMSGFFLSNIFSKSCLSNLVLKDKTARSTATPKSSTSTRGENIPLGLK